MHENGRSNRVAKCPGLRARSLPPKQERADQRRSVGACVQAGRAGAGVAGVASARRGSRGDDPMAAVAGPASGRGEGGVGWAVDMSTWGLGCGA